MKCANEFPWIVVNKPMVYCLKNRCHSSHTG